MMENAFVQTLPVDVSYGGSLEFLIRYGADDPFPGCEDGEKEDEEVYLQYSIDNGSTWVTFFDRLGYNGQLYRRLV